MRLSQPSGRLLHLPLLLLVLLFAALPFRSVAQTVTVDGIQYTIDTYTREAQCTGPANGESTNRNGLTIESSVTYNGVSYPVTSIGNRAFYNCTDFTGSLTISNSVKTIEEYAFSGCSGFNGSLNLGNSVITIGERAFSNCSGFNGTLTIPNSVTTIGQSAFSMCSGFTGELTIPNSVISIGRTAFYNCTGFTGSLTIGNSVKTIEQSAFNGCTGFNGSLNLGNSVTSIEQNAFYNCKGFTGNLTIPETVTSIGSQAFYNCKGFTGDLVIPNSMTSIEYGVFSGCNGLSGSLSIPNSVISIGDNAFLSCSGLTGTLIIPNNVISIGELAFSNCSGFTGSPRFPDSVTTIGENAFKGCTGFSGSLTIPNSVTSIGQNAFRDCTGFTGTLSIGTSIQELPTGAFRDCTGFTSLYLSSSIKSIGNYCFSSIKFETIECDATFPPSEKGSEIFNDASYYAVLFVPSASISAYKQSSLWGNFRNIQPNNEPWMLKFDPSSLTIYNGDHLTLNPVFTPSNVTDKSLQWSSSDVTVASVENGVLVAHKPGRTTITARATSHPVSASCEVTVLTNIFETNDMTLLYDSSLGGVVITKIPDKDSYIIPEKVYVQSNSGITEYKVLGVQLESQPALLKKAAYPDGIPHNFTSSVVTIPYSPSNSVIKDGVIVDKTLNALIYVHTSIEGSYFIDSDIQLISSNAFAHCNALKEISIPSSVTSVGTDAFRACKGLSQVIIEDATSSIELADAFSDGCTMDYLYVGRKISTNISWPVSLKAIETGRYVDTLPANTFASLPSLYSLTIGVGMRSIDTDAFRNSKITKVLWLPNTPPTGYNSIQADINYVSTTNYDLSNMVVSANLSSKFMSGGLVYVFNRQAGDRTCAVIDSRYDRYTTALNVPHKVTYQGIEFTVEEINDYALYCNKYYQSAIVGDGIVSIGKYALYNCDAIVSAPYIGKSVKTVGDFAFHSCYGIPSIIIPDATEYLGVSSLANCTALESAILGKGMRVIERACFAGDGKLRQIVVPANVSTIANEVFDGCTALSYLEISDRTTPLTLGYSKHNSQYKPADGVIGGLATAGVPLFNDCHLKEIYIGGDISYSTSPADGYSPFYRNDYLEKVIIFNNETEISDNEFYGCRNLKEVIVGNDVTRVGDYAFSGCLSIEYFTLGSHVETIGIDAFSDCDKMLEFKSLNRIPPVCGNQATDDINKFTCTLYVPREAVAAYQSADQWRNFFHIEGMDVEIVLVESISLDPQEWTGDVGSTVNIKASVEPSNADNKNLSWASSNISVATVNENGLVTIVGEGTCVITARANDGSNVSATCRIESKSSGIDGLFTNNITSVEVHTILGVKLNIHSLEEFYKLSPGFYIVNGKKILLK